MLGAFALLSPLKCQATSVMWEMAKKEGLPLPETANDIMESLDGNMPLYYWTTRRGEEVRFTIDHYNMQAELELFDNGLNLKRSYVFRLKPELIEIKEG